MFGGASPQAFQTALHYTFLKTLDVEIPTYFASLRSRESAPGGSQIMRSLFRNLGSLLQSFLQARQGNVVIFAALALIPMVELVGAAIDYSRANLVRVNIQAALDSTALMLANDTAVPSMSQSQLQTKATNVFTALFDPVYAQNVSVTPTYSAGQPPKVTMSATATVPAYRLCPSTWDPE